jgi:hypothetical protein
MAKFSIALPQLEAPPEARESPETLEEEPERAEPQSAIGETQAGTQRRWWEFWR